MIVARNRDELETALRPGGGGHGTLGFVPTMGSLHEGHLRLVDLTAARSDCVVASVFVNPTQFAEGEDYGRYPRSADADAQLLADRGCDVLFLPTVEDIYPTGFATSVTVEPGLTSRLCGISRGSSHFDGVTTVVARLFGLVRPDVATFGEKDWQQATIIGRMATDLFPSVEIVVGETVRDFDGLALSSRNQYLDGPERERARAVPLALATGAGLVTSGVPVPEAIEAAELVLRDHGLEPEYVEVIDPLTLEPSDGSGADSRIAIAALLPSARLIDNCAVTSPPVVTAMSFDERLTINTGAVAGKAMSSDQEA